MAEVFRKSALDRAAGPEHLDDYINVSNPSVWVVLGAILAFLLGVGAWCLFGRIADVQPALLRVSGGEAVCYLDQSRASSLTAGDPIEVSGVQGTVVQVQDAPVSATSLSSSESELLKPESSWLACAAVSIDMPDGVYEAQVTVDQIEPVSLLLNRS